MKKIFISSMFIITFMFLVIFCLYPYLPHEIPIHWNTQGVDTYGSRNQILFYPCMMIFLNIMMIALPFLDPRKENYAKFNKTYLNLFWLMNITFIIIFIVIVFAIFYPSKADINLLIQVIVGVLIFFMGNMMPRIRQNYFVGIKTPWTCADERVWKKTHRFSGRLWFCGGIFLVLVAFFPSVSLWLNFIIFIIIAILPIAYSYIIYKKLNIKEKIYD